ncbi:hypothetical protein UA08_06285 [Talaromyces atroroseus]|uniref:Mucin n=1 Tax=Talaromyces atroroseus TaxID=1441469 RepID=A0A225AVK6_TALAT|nr:hypothetical protein UA08_06285 [Talaromyces atroroseus]OKL58465.1 hypothetical protein UA08_06285 [Talaromyces atroroseus]
MQMQDFIVSSPDDFESLPPAVQRKFFSNLERFRLLTTTTQSPRHHAHHDYAAKRPLSIRTKTSSAVVTNRHHRQKAYLRRRPRSAVDYNFDQVHEYWQCFHSLPPKIQKVIFSKEEQRLLQRTAPVSQIVDAADQALLKFEERQRASLQESRSRRDSDSFGTYDGELERRRSRGVASSIPSSASARPSSGDPSDSGIEMEESILDSFRWLDEDDDLDLSLDSYHKYVSETAGSQSQNAAQQKPATPRRMPSFRRTLSLAKNRNSMFIGSSRTLNSSQSSTIPFSSAGSHNHSYNSRPNHHTRSSHHRHVSNRSTSSIDPAAQYYQDPEARLKLRVYLASPQKFDEAIEFGFPSLDNNHKENIDSSTRRQGANRDSKRISQISSSTQGWTFLDDETTSIDLSLLDYAHESQQRQRQSQYMHFKDAVSSNLHDITPITSDMRRSQPLKPSTSAGNATSHRREMTLKMTLTRPDLRTHATDDDPLRLAELPPADETLNIWDDLPEDRGVVKKMWRKLRGWRD